MNFPNRSILNGSSIREMSNEALMKRVNNVDIFAEIEPNQKERIILALRKSGNVVGYMGDGINDASALHAADVGISVNSAVDVAKEVADIVLLEKDLRVLANGVLEGRKTFANTLKYVFMATSANFGNMFSMAGASLFLSFLPLLPKQILLTNLLTDFPEMTIATDSVDQEMLSQPRRWNIKFIRNFMLVFGLLSSVFRLPDLRCPSSHPPCISRRIQDRLVHGIRYLCINDRAGRPNQGTFPEKQAEQGFIDSHSPCCRGYNPFPLYPYGNTLWICTDTTPISFDAPSHCRALYHFSRGGEKNLL